MQRLLACLLFAGLVLPATAQQRPQPGAQPSPLLSEPGSPRLRSDTLDRGRDRSRSASTAASARRAAGTKSLSAETVQISAMGPDADPAFDALHPAITYNPASDEYLVVWAGTDNSGSLVADETEIYAQRVDPASAQPVGERIRVSEMGVDGDPSFAALHPAVAYNPVQDAYFAVWQGSASAGEFEIYGRAIRASDGSLGVTQRLTHMGPDGDATVHALAPSLAVNTDTGTYYVVWHSNAGGEVEVYGRVLDASGQPTGSGPTALSAAGPAGDPDWRAADPAAAYDPTTGEYWVVWSGSDTIDGLVAGEHEIFLRRVAPDGVPAGSGALRISRAGPDGDARIDAVRPQIVVDASLGELFVVWSANAPDGGGAFDIYAQRVDAATGAEVGTDDLRLSTMGASGERAFSGFAPVVAGTPGREYRVIWRGDDTVDDAFELYTQAVFADRSAGDEGPDDDVLLTALSGGRAGLGAVTAAVARSARDTYLAVWSGDTDGSGLVPGEHEILGRIVGDGTTLPVELVAFTATSSDTAIRLTWRTLGERNSDRFEVQRQPLLESSAPRAAPEAWTTVGTVRSAGTSNAPVDYSFTDARVPYAADEVVYRLRQVDVDGTASLSDELRVSRGAITSLTLLGTFPNPAHTAVTIRFAVPESVRRSADARLTLYDILGRRVRRIEVGEQRGRQEIRLDVGGLASSIYFLRLEVAGQYRTQRIAVTR